MASRGGIPRDQWEPGLRIAPRDDQFSTFDALASVLADEHTHDATAQYHELWLRKVGHANGQNVWKVHRDQNARPIEVINCDAFRTATELDNCLTRLRAAES
jgi:hypothetical protein